MFLKDKEHLFSYLKLCIPKSLLFIFLFLVPSITFSQSINDTISIKPHAIKNTEIANYRNNTKLLIEATEELLRNLKKIEQLKSQIISGDSTFSSKIVVLKDSLSRFNLAQIERLENQIKEYNVQLNAQEKTISAWRKQTSEKQERMSIDLQNWKLTADSLKIAQGDLKTFDQTHRNILENVNGQIERSLKGLTELQTKINFWDNQLIKTENALTAAKGQVNEINSLIKSKRKEVLSNIWVPEYAPIWQLQPSDSTTFYTKFKSIMRIRAERLKDHFSSSTEFYYSVFFSFIFIVSLIIFIKIKSHKDYVLDQNSNVDPHLVVKYPVLSSFVILIFLLTIFYSIPLELKTLILLISIFPFAVLMWELNSKKRHFIVFIFIFYSLFFNSIPLLSEYPVLLRYNLLFINSLSLIITLLLRKNKEFIEQENAYWLGLLPFLISAIVFLNSLAIIGNIIGNVQLSVILTETAIGTFLAFAIIKESVKLLHSFFYLLIKYTLTGYSNILKDDNEKVLLGLFKTLKYASILLWFYTILGFLKVRTVMTEYFLIFINKPLKVGELSISLGNIIAFFLIIQLSVWISQLIRYVLDKEIYPRTSIDKGIASTFSLMIRYTLIIIGFVLALAAAGLEYNKIAIGMGALGIGIGFGLQNIVSNFISGIILAIERPIKIGDIVKVDEILGEVKDIGLRASQIRTSDGADVIVPNGNLISGKLINWTFLDRMRRLEFEVVLDMESDIMVATQVILDASDKVPKILKTPKPIVNFEGIKEGSAVVKVYGWINDYSESFSAGTLFKVAIHKALMDKGFKLANPILDVNVNKENTPSK